MTTLLTFAVGGAVGLLFFRLKVPGGMMIGAICGTLILSLTLHCAVMPYAAKFAAQITAGAFIGCSVDRSDLLQLRCLYKTVLVVLGSFLLLNLTVGFVIWQLTGMDLLTALLCCVPGGINDVPLAASDMGADVSAVVMLQFVRLCVGLGIFPLWITWVNRNETGSEPDGAACDPQAQKDGKNARWYMIAAVFLVAAVCGYIGRRLGVPSGPLIFSILGALAVKVLLFPVRLPRPIKRFAQVLSGTYIGCSISYEALFAVNRLIVPAACVIAGYMLNSLLAGKLLHKKFQVPPREAMLMVTPAGASDMALISADIGVQSSALIVTHILRMLAASTIFPQICYQVSKLFSNL